MVPEDWKRGIIVPVYKGNGDSRELNTLRPAEHSWKNNSDRQSERDNYTFDL